MKWLVVALCAALLAGCASSGVIPMGSGIYMLSKTSAGCGMASADGVKAGLYKEAGAFCQKSGKDIDVLDTSGKNGIVMVQCASAEIKFSCVSSLDPTSKEFAARQRQALDRIAQDKASQPSETIVVSRPIVMPAPVQIPMPAPLPQRKTNVSCVSRTEFNSVYTDCN